MTDEYPPIIPPTPAKDMWTRCPACSTVMPNIGIAKQGHKLNCPHDLNLKIQKLEEKIRALEGQLVGVSGHVEGLASEPAVDLAGVAPWDDEDDEVGEHVTVQTSSIPVVRIPNPFDDDDDDEDLPAVR